MIAHMSVDKAGVSADQDQVSAFSQFQTHSSLHSDVKAGALHISLASWFSVRLGRMGAGGSLEIYRRLLPPFCFLFLIASSE